MGVAEEMIKSLQRLSWRKVDVSFHSALWPFLAHNHIHVRKVCALQSVVLVGAIRESRNWVFDQMCYSAVHILKWMTVLSKQVKQEWLFYEGAGVVVHVADTIKEQDLSAQFSARL